MLHSCPGEVWLTVEGVTFSASSKDHRLRRGLLRMLSDLLRPLHELLPRDLMMGCAAL